MNFQERWPSLTTDNGESLSQHKMFVKREEFRKLINYKLTFGSKQRGKVKARYKGGL